MTSATRWLLGLACALALAESPAHAAELRCADWHRLAAEQKDARLREQIDAVVRSPEERQIKIDAGALRRCLEAEAARILDAFDDACAEGREADLEVLNRIFRDYVASCAG
jgi:hypothetical protein